jgi:hypothetical protein
MLADLSSATKAPIQSLQFGDSEIARLKAKMAATSTARIAYTNELKVLLAQH